MLKEKIISKAKELGFDLIGFAEYQNLDKEIKRLKIWLENNYHAGMEYMKRNIDKRKDAKLILENCKSVISLGMNYYIDEKTEETNQFGKVSRYAWGKDYHLIIWEKLDELINYIKIYFPNFDAKSYVDTGPVMDKVWAIKAGLGWQGKHSNVISKEIGSWFFIATIFTNQEFNDYDTPQKDYCGCCTACIDACPTNAIVDNYIVDSNKCISYLTIENKNEIPNDFIGKFNNWIFGCDICQDVCPWNIKFAQQTSITELKIIKNKRINLEETLELEPKNFKEKYEDSPILRAKIKGLKRNAEFLLKTI